MVPEISSGSSKVNGIGLFEVLCSRFNFCESKSDSEGESEGDSEIGVFIFYNTPYTTPQTFLSLLQLGLMV